MGNGSVAYVAFDTAKLHHAVAIAEEGRTGEVRFIGEIENNEAAAVKLVKKLAQR
jgi:transposase